MIKIRKVKLADLEEVTKIRRASLPSAWKKSSFQKMLVKYPAGFLVAENEKEIIGYIIGGIKEDSGLIISLAIKPAWRKKGIGANLLQNLLRIIGRDPKKIFLHVRTWNKEAVDFYKSFKFKIAETTKGHYKNGDDAYLMEKEI
ncbi:MAG: ribosomal protein S18-alanine N-acetyltransferase [bacterium]